MSEVTSQPSEQRPVPIALPANVPDERPYRGGLGISRFRGSPVPSEWCPEDFVASTTEVFGGGGVGLTVLPSGETLRSAIERDPVCWLGAEHARRWGADTRILVKMLDTRERLFVHFHPDETFAAAQLGRDLGKTEAWIITSVDGDGSVWLGFDRDVPEATLLDWFETQNTAAMLDAMNHITVAPGDALFVPASVAHAIGAGITLVELQEPTDLSVILEWKGYRGLRADSALLGLPPEIAMRGLDRRELAAHEIDDLRSMRQSHDRSTPFPERADRYFRAEILDVDGEIELDASFAVLVVMAGTGTLDGTDTSVDLVAGQTILVPYAFGASSLRGDLTVIRARPPQP